MPEQTSKIKAFSLGLGVSAVVLLSFFAGGLADRVFVIKPLDFVAKRSGGGGVFTAPGTQNDSKLGQLIQQNAGLTVADVAEVASESVVTVSIKRQQQVVQPVFPGLFGFSPSLPSGEVEEIQQDIGTGFVVDESGLIVTNKHVVSATNAEYKVIDKEGTEHTVEKIYRDPTNDLAILQVSGAALEPLAMGDSGVLRVGESVIAIGTALGEFRHTVTTGVISGIGRSITAGNGFSAFEELQNVIQTDAAINPGNSGGPLLNNRGEVIGVNVAVSANAQNVGFALPINVIKDSIANFNETGQFERPFFGVRYQMISEQAALTNEVPQGAYIVEVVPDSTAAAAGIEQGDIITKLDDQPLKAEGTLAEVMNKKKVGAELKITYWRDSKESTTTVTLRAAQE